jgi:hypothetical protein
MPPLHCDRTAACLNFRHAPKTYCSTCARQINMNHFHSVSDRYRLCVYCLYEHLPLIETGRFEPPSTTDGERPECVRIGECFASRLYELYVPKLCDGCNKYPSSHFHDIERNIRLCLKCFMARGDFYRPTIGKATPDENS